MALKALGIGKGDEVIVPVNTVTADAEAVLLCGAKPRFVDVNDDGNVHDFNPKKAKAIIAVHMYGHPCDMRRLAMYGLPIIEDCSHAHGAEYHGKKVGSLGDIGVFSFFPSKVLGGFGDGGCITTNNEEYAEKVKRLRDHGRTGKFDHIEWGFNFRLDGIQAAILNAKLPKLDEFVEKRRRVANRYMSLKTYIPSEASECKHSYYVYPIRFNDRDFLRGKLAELGVNTSIHYPKILTHQKAYKKFGRFKKAERIAETTLSLPMYPELSREDQDYIINAVNGVLK